MANKEPTFNVTGAAGNANPTTANAAGIVHGGMGNTNRNVGNRRIGNIGHGANANQGDGVESLTAQCTAGELQAKQGSGPFQGLALTSITCEMIVAVLKDKGLEDIAEIFKREEIDGNLFAILTEGDMDEIKIPTGFKRKKLLKIQSDLPGGADVE